VLQEWGLATLAPDTELLVSEMTTNAAAISNAMGRPAIRLLLASDGVRVVISVWDACSDPPLMAVPDVNAENGRGLLLVENVSAQWGWEYHINGDGKIVWAVVDTASAARTEF
jgi:hypothetical protein